MIVVNNCLFINNSMFILIHFCRPSNRLCIYYCCHNGGIADKLQLERIVDVLPVRMVTSLAAAPRDHGRHQQWRQFVGGSSPASGASSTTLGVSLLCIKDAVSREHFAAPSSFCCSWKRVQRRDFNCISDFAHRIDQFLCHHRVSMLRPHRRIAPLFGKSAAHGAFIANSDFRKDWNPKGGNRRKW